ncbi:transposase [Streptomyces sp. 3211]|uniref:transposase n=1 Tax=Streptomyces sp. 3211 TaxID=1964449 RepID=UPI0017A056D8|nr:transposase [Streptomyces sp. 3211]
MGAARFCIDVLVSRAEAEGLWLTGEGGQFRQLAKRLPESALEGEVMGYFVHDKHDPAGKNDGNSRIGTRAKTVLADVGPVEISVLRDRVGSFEPKIVKRRLTRVVEMVISLSAKGLTTGEVPARLVEVCGVEVGRRSPRSPARSSRAMAEWQNRLLDPVCPVVFIDAVRVKVRDGAVADRPVLEPRRHHRRPARDPRTVGRRRRQRQALHALTEIKNRDVNDVLMPEPG